MKRVHGAVWRFVICAVSLASSALAASMADPPGCDTALPTIPTIPSIVFDPIEENCENTERFASQCWWFHRADTSGTSGLELAPGESLGYPLNINLLNGPTGGSFPPRSRNPLEGSSPFIPLDALRDRAPVSLGERPVLAGTVDLVTGVPLVQENDFELSFGGAVFRHIRTYSEIPFGFGNPQHSDPSQRGAFWDWQGHRWMMSENPIFLIDAAQADLVGNHRPMCFFIPDAHHSIPFQLKDLGNGNAVYEAPPYMDAVLQHNGAGWDDDARRWATPPTEFTLWMDRGSVRYTIEAQYHLNAADEIEYDDIYHHVRDDDSLGSMHEPPDYSNGLSLETGGLGIPGYGLVKKIEDRRGNRIEFEHCAPVQNSSLDDPQTPCQECLQNCTEKGQLRTAKLFAAGDQEPTWTLVYVHRNFWLFGNMNSQWDYENARGKRWLGENYLHAVYVYKGDPTLPATGCFTLDGQLFFKDIDTFDQVDAIDAVSLLGLPTNWVKQARYVYTEHGRPTLPVPANTEVFGESSLIFQRAFHSVENPSPPCLLKATVIDRDVGGNPPSSSRETSDTTLYRYHQYAENVQYQWGPASYPQLQSIYHPDAVRKITGATVTVSGPLNLPPNSSAINKLMEYPENGTTVRLTNPQTQQEEEVPLESLASIRLEHQDLAYAAFPATAFCEELVQTYIRGQPSELLPLVNHADHNVTILAAAGAGGVKGYYRLWRFLRIPVGVAGNMSVGHSALTSVLPLPRRTLAHAPFYWQTNFNGVTSEIQTRPLNEATWITVVDQFDTLAEARAFDAAQSNPDKPRGREVVQVNAAGHVVKRRSWTFDRNGDATITGNMGMVEEYVYEAFEYETEDGTGYDRSLLTRDFRIREKHTLGVAAAELQTPATDETEGLVFRYGYADDSSPVRPPSREIVRVSVKKGRGEEQVLVPVSDFERDSVRKDLVTIERKYGDGQAVGNVTEVVERSYTLGTPVDPNVATSAPIVEKLVKRARTALSPADMASPQYYAVEKEHYDAQGRRDWRGYGTVLNPASPGSDPLDRFFLDCWQYDDRGRMIVQVQDVGPDANGNVYARRGTAAAFAYQIGQPPAGYSRVVPTGESISPLNYVTAFEYNDLGQTACHYPNGQADYTVYIQMSPDEIRTMKYPKVTYTLVGGQGEFHGINGVWVMDYDGGQPQEMVQAALQNVVLTLPVMGGEAIVPLSTTTPTFDSAGRITSIRTEGQDGSSVAASLAYDPFGSVAREVAADGTITRKVNDPLGRLERVFRGTKDAHDQWNTSLTASNNDNMVLLERYRYGATPNDAGKVVSIRRMRERPSNQYGVDGPALDESDEENYGWLEIHKYDWRMRDVWVERHRKGGTDLAPDLFDVRVTWFDNQDRPRYVAVYKPTGSNHNERPTLGTVDPTALFALKFSEGEVTNEVTTADILATAPAELAETIYNDRGLVQQTRQYRISTTNPGNYTSDYLATTTFYDHNDRPVWIRQPNGGVRRNSYDAKGRQIKSWLLVGTKEVEATFTSYDADDNAIVMETRQRNHNNGTGDTLTSANSVATFVFNWYDGDKRLIASADLGTGGTDDAAGNVFQNAATAPTRSSEAPTEAQPLLNLPSYAKVTINTYDSTGRLIRTRHPGGMITESTFDDLGRAVLMTERGESSGPIRRTGYKYDEAGRLVNMAAVREGHQLVNGRVNWAATDSTLQVTQFVYGDGADIVSEIDPNYSQPYLPAAFTTISWNQSLIRSVRFPSSNPADGGQPKSTDDLLFTYYPDGQLATRTDALGNRFCHYYNERSERYYSAVEDPAISGSSPVPIPPDRSSITTYTYDALQRPLTATLESITNNGGGSFSVATVGQIAYDYDGLGNLLKERQAQGGLVQSNTPAVEYTWQFSPESTFQAGSNYSRLGTMKYPQWVGLSRQRTLQFSFGAAGEIDDELCRVVKVHDNYINVGYGHAIYSYAGAGRRVETAYGSNGTTFASKQSFFNGGSGYPLLDRFGRVADLHFKRSTGSATLHRTQYGYDAADNRLYGLVTQYQTGSTTHYNDRSWLHGYDALNRLTGSTLGELNDTTRDSIITANFAPRAIQWDLDTLGNWNGGDAPLSTVNGKTVSFDTSIPPNGTLDDPIATRHSTDPRNELDSVTVQIGSGTPTTTTYYYNANGNLVADDTFFYQYDAYNRLVQVNKKGSLTFNGDGTINSGTAGSWVAHYTYDAVGRLMRKQVPWNFNRTALRTEAYYYDGVRRVHEVFTDPKPGTFPETANQGDPPSNPVYVTSTSREYIWAPGGGAPGYVDELVCQITPSNAAQYVLQDANYNAVALVSAAGTVLSQFTYDPYGEPIIAEQGINGTTSQVADLRVGHQGLFLDRLNLLGNGALDVSGATGTNWTIAAPGGGLGNKALYQNRNRSYVPTTGRFLQADPNGRSLALLATSTMHGFTFTPEGLRVAPTDMTIDGMSAFQYSRSNPIIGCDPMGLEFSLSGLGQSMGIQGLIGGLINGAITSMRPGGSFWSGFAKGAAAGALGGAAGYGANLAFTGASGLFASLWVRGAAVGAASGAANGAGLSALDGNSLQHIIADGLAGGMLGGAVGGLGGKAFSWLGQSRFGLWSSAAARIPAAKLSFLLNGKHSNLFRNILGFTESNVDDLARQLRQTLDDGVAFDEITEYGMKACSFGNIRGPNGAVHGVKATWQVDNGSDIPKFITAHSD